MTTAIVESRVKLTTVDASSAKINKVNKSLSGTSKQLELAAQKSQALGNSLRSAMSGDVIGAVKGLSGALGGGAGGLAATAGVAAAGIGVLAVGVAAAAYKFTMWSVEIERTRAGLDAVFGEEGIQRAVDLSNAIGGVTAESVGKLGRAIKLAGINASFTVEELQELTNRATVAGVSGDEAMEALARSIQTGTTRALKMTGTVIDSTHALDEYRAATKKATTEIDAQDRALAVVAALHVDLQKKVGATSNTFARQDDALKTLDNAWFVLKSRISGLLADEAVGLIEWSIKAIGYISRFGNTMIETVKLIMIPWTNMFKTIGKGFSALEAAASGDWKEAMARAAEAVRQGAIGTIEDGYKQIGVIAKAAAGDVTQGWLDELSRGSKAALAAMDKLSVQGAAGVARTKAKPIKATAPKAAGKSIAEIMLDAEKRAADALFDSMVRLEEVKAKVLEADAKAHDETMARHAEMSRQFQESKQQERDMAKASSDEQVAGYFAIAQAGINAASDLGAATIVVAGLQAGYAIALGLRAIAEKGWLGIPQMIAGISAAAQFAAVAGQSPPSVSSGGGGGLTSPGQSTASAAPSQQSTGPTVVNVWGVANTKAELGHALAKAAAAARGTGMVPA